MTVSKSNVIEFSNRCCECGGILTHSIWRGETTCLECGLVHSEKEIGYPYHPYPDKYGFYNTLQTAVKNKNQIGNRSERKQSPAMIRRMSKLNQYDNSKTRILKAQHETRYFISYLQLPESIFWEIIQRFIKYHAQLEKGTKDRGINQLVPVCVYISCKCNNMMFDRKRFIDLLKTSKKKYNHALLSVLMNNEDLKTLNRDESRKRQIMALLSSLNINHGFLSKSKTFLETNWDLLKNKKNNVIAGCIHAVLENEYHSNNKACKQLNTLGSTVSKVMSQLNLRNIKIEGETKA